MIGGFAAAAIVAGTAGADGFLEPNNNVVLSLGVGSVSTIHPTLHLDAAPAKADIILAFDTTGSMGAAISDAKNDANAIVTDIKSSIPGAKFAIVDFKDYPTSPYGGTGDYPWRVDQNFTDNSGLGPCAGPEFPATPIQCALNGLSAGGGSDEPEAYNRAFYEAYNDTAHLTFTSGAPRFMVVLGDSLPHDATLHTDFPSCPDTPPTDPGPDGVQGTADDLRTASTLAALKAHNTNVSFVTYNPRAWQGGPYQVADCQASIAAYTGGNAVTHAAGTASLESQIVNLINQAASHIDGVTFTPTAVSAPAGVTNFDPSTWVSYNPPQPYGPISAPADITFDQTITVPQDTALGQYKFDVHALADGNERAVQHITVNVTRSGVSALAMSADEPSVPAGIAAVPVNSIPGSRLSALTPDVGSAAAGSIAAGSIASGSIASGSIAAGSIAAGSIASGSIAAGSIAAGSIGLGVAASGSIAAGSIPSGGQALKSVL
ncbi:MAG: hypothetical protein WBB76_04920, partial [Gaiellaceae bacterium]